MLHEVLARNFGANNVHVVSPEEYSVSYNGRDYSVMRDGTKWLVEGSHHDYEWLVEGRHQDYECDCEREVAMAILRLRRKEGRFRMKHALDNMTLCDRIKRAVAISELELDWEYVVLNDDAVVVRDNRRGLEHCVYRSASWREPGKFTYDVDTFRIGEHRAICMTCFDERAKFFDVFMRLLEEN